MSPIHVEASHVIDARPEDIYAILTDYRVGHPAILPKPYFTNLTVEQGGQGAGTIFDVRMKIFGREYAYHQVASEPEPGRVLVETNLDGAVTTTFTVDPIDGGKQSRVTISTDAKPSPGFAGLMERLMQPRVAGNIYKKELLKLADYVRSKHVAADTLGNNT